MQVYCKACHVCTTRKTAGWHQKARMCRYDVGFPMEGIAIDWMGSFSESDLGNKYVLVVVDTFQYGWRCTQFQTVAQTVAEKLVLELISRFWLPYQIKSYQG